jgi:xanthine dehydrogenase YagR molybdenum-binding subunit
VRVEIGDSSFGQAMLAGGSMGTSRGAQPSSRLSHCSEHGRDRGAACDTSRDAIRERASLEARLRRAVREVHVDVDTCEIRVPRMFGMFACGRIINPKTARSQLIGGMTMGIGMALLEETLLDARLGAYVNHDLAMYHVAVNADVDEIEATWIDEEDLHVNPMGAKGIGEVGIVGAAAAVANAVYDATGVRVRDLPIRPDKLLGRV